jgi:hypothetical protein
MRYGVCAHHREHGFAACYVECPDCGLYWQLYEGVYG